MTTGTSHFRLQIRKEALKFSAAHMTVFADGTKERIHGHNYRTQISLKTRDFSLQGMLPFSEVKKAMRLICDSWDERLFLPALCPHLKVNSRSSDEIDFQLCGKRYVVPADEVVSLDVENVTTESLAREFSRRLLQILTPAELQNYGVIEVEVLIEEMLGQGAAYVTSFDSPSAGSRR
jgi:6-pyruvoyltetrahydropterin/6-carboxytetrahydropterin synthase